MSGVKKSIATTKTRLREEEGGTGATAFRCLLFFEN